MSRRHARLVFSRELLDFRRERRVLLRLFVQPFVFLLMLAAPAVFVQQAQAREESDSFTVAVEGDIDAVPGLRAALDREPFEYVVVDDAPRAVVARAVEAGVTIPADAAERIRAGDTVPLEVSIFSTQDVTERALPTLSQRLLEIGRTEAVRILEASGHEPALASPLAVTTTDVATTSSEGIRFSLAQGLPVLLVIQLYGMVGLVQARLGGAKDRRTLESLLVLPVHRRDLLVGIGLAGLVVGTASSLVIFLPLTLVLTTAVAALSQSVAAPAVVAATLVVGASLVALLFAALGLWLGARAGSGSAGSVTVTLVQLAVFGSAIIVPFLSEVEATGPVLAVPVVGAVLFVRDGITVGATLPDIAVLLAGQLAVAALLLQRATVALGTAKNVLRAVRA